jgi:DNA-binding NtrC family response regulator
MLEVFDFARKVARHYTNVLQAGPTGTGKELVARAIHQISPVSQQKLAVCNCSAMVDTLLESQLFGHVRGAFTGATDARPGLFEYANDGTVFLDEVGETSLPMQAKLLRVIQNREIQRVGSPEVRHINVRLIAAANRDLRGGAGGTFSRRSFLPAQFDPDPDSFADGAAGRYPAAGAIFLEEIQHRLREKHIRADTAGADGFAAARVAGKCAGIGDRHLQRVHNGDGRFHRSGGFAGATATPGGARRGRRRLEAAVARRGAKGHIRRVLGMCQGNRLRAAQFLGIGRTSLYRYLKRDGLDIRKEKSGGAAA